MLERRSLFALFVLFAACHRDTRDDGVGTYWCVTGAESPARLAGRCTATEQSCTDHLRAAGSDAGALRCTQTRTLAYHLRWNSQYGASEGWFVNAASCERARLAFQRPPAPCTAAPWERTGRRAH